MKTKRIIYWIATSLITAMMLMAGMSYFTTEEIKITFTHLGFPNYFRVELGMAKLIGAIVLILPPIKGKIKEWAYAGFTITFVSAIIAHLSVGDDASKWFAPLVALILLITSYYMYSQLQKNKIEEK